MAKCIVRIISCDRCEKEIRCKYIGKTSLDGGFSQVLDFEKAPEDWNFHTELGWFCPDCEKDYKKMIHEFMRYNNE